MLRLILTFSVAIWHWPLGTFLQQPAKPVADADASRDCSVVEVVLNDILARRDLPLILRPGRPHILFSQEPPAKEVTVARVLKRQDAKAWDKLSGVQLELARQAAEDLVRRLPKKDAYASLGSKDNRIRVLDKNQTEAALRIGFPDRPELFSAYAPGYSPDKRLAVVRLDFTLEVHGGVGTYILARKDGRWVVLLRDFRCFF